MRKSNYRKKNNNSGNLLKIGFLIILSPYILISLILWILKVSFILFGWIPDWFKVWIDTKGYTFDLKDYIIFFIYFFQAIVTALFSYYLWQTSEKSNDLAKQISDSEERREQDKDKSIVRENALIVYYDLLLGIKDLVRLYNNKILKRETISPKRLYFSNEWIKNVAMLKEELSYDDFNSIYLLYGDLLTIKDLLYEKGNNDLNEEIERIFKKVVSENILEYVYEINLNFSNVEVVLNNYYEGIFEKLKKLIYKPDEIEIIEDKSGHILLKVHGLTWYKGNINEKGFNGSGELFANSDLKRYDGVFKNGIFISGWRREYYDNGDLMYEIKYENGIRTEGCIKGIDGKVYSEGKYKDNVFFTGYCKLYNKNGQVQYIGELKDSKYEGKGIYYYDKSHTKDGTWVNGYFSKGIEHNGIISDSDGYDFYEQQSWIESQIELSGDEEYEKYQQEQYEESVEANATGWTEYADIDWNDGEYKVLSDTIHKQYNFD